ncbi:hypothetical protein L228DRAFT_248223 [Xylona heveae TC161]|uniref:Dihydrofolate reductase n=1 Tax=Xylona heveae (strain CBS 132557 / TC161) TaxID=1328760 RepID=A0A165FXL9_XYLHT|nr:hypothetical protein L228DRAFT_248223 [Xylona heveae TC161]KZF21508.1 hypothetical protein L228DRAFT_248223 [Xylona heveae TC161]
MSPHTPSCPASPQLTLIVAATLSKGIGLKGGLPWQSLRSDMRYFARVTKRTPRGNTTTSDNGPEHNLQSHRNRTVKLTNAVIMGRKTWDSIPPRFRPLPDRLNVVVSRRPAELGNLPEGAIAAGSLEEALKMVGGRCIPEHQDGQTHENVAGNEKRELSVNEATTGVFKQSTSASTVPASADSSGPFTAARAAEDIATPPSSNDAQGKGAQQDGQIDGSGLSSKGATTTITSTKPETPAAGSTTVIDRVFVIGGAEMYRLAAQLPYTRRVLLTEVTTPFECDTFFPLQMSASEGWRKASHAQLERWVGETVPEGIISENGIDFEFQMFEKEEN